MKVVLASVYLFFSSSSSLILPNAQSGSSPLLISGDGHVAATSSPKHRCLLSTRVFPLNVLTLSKQAVESGSVDRVS